MKLSIVVIGKNHRKPIKTKTGETLKTYRNQPEDLNSRMDRTSWRTVDEADVSPTRRSSYWTLGGKMITENDIKTLKRHETRMGPIEYWILNIAPIFLVVVGSLNLWLASIIGSSKGYNLGGLCQSLIEGINVNHQYSGLYLKAMERLETALFQFGLAIIFIFAIYGYRRRRKMEIRILETLRQNGLLTD